MLGVAGATAAIVTDGGRGRVSGGTKAGGIVIIRHVEVLRRSRMQRVEYDGIVGMIETKCKRWK